MWQLDHSCFEFPLLWRYMLYCKSLCVVVLIKVCSAVRTWSDIVCNLFVIDETSYVFVHVLLFIVYLVWLAPCVCGGCFFLGGGGGGCCSFVFWFSSSSSSCSFFFSFFDVLYEHSYIMLSLSFVVVEIRDIKYLFPMSFVVEVKTGGIHSHYFISNTVVSIQARELEM